MVDPKKQRRSNRGSFPLDLVLNYDSGHLKGKISFLSFDNSFLGKKLYLAFCHKDQKKFPRIDPDKPEECFVQVVSSAEVIFDYEVTSGLIGSEKFRALFIVENADNDIFISNTVFLDGKSSNSDPGSSIKIQEKKVERIKILSYQETLISRTGNFSFVVETFDKNGDPEVVDVFIQCSSEAEFRINNSSLSKTSVQQINGKMTVCEVRPIGVLKSEITVFRKDGLGSLSLKLHSK
jgi:hypothetical protein